MYRVTKDGSRICNKCDVSKPLTEEYFIKDATRPLGFAYECRPCHRIRKRLNPGKKIPWAQRSQKRRDAAKRLATAYRGTAKGRAVFMAASCRKTDKGKGRVATVTWQWIMENIFPHPCIYCGTTDSPRGCERVSNATGHTTENCVPACLPCNFARGDNFSHEEMKRIGVVIAEIRHARSSDTCAGLIPNAVSRENCASGRPKKAVFPTS